VASEDFLTTYLSQAKILIADPSSVSRSTVAKCLTEMGAKTANLALTSQLQDAAQIVSQAKPNMIVCDYDLGNSQGLYLFELQRDLEGFVRENVLQILITGNTSQSAVAQAAEEDVDGFILKPYTTARLKQMITQSASVRLNPSNYLEFIAEGRKQLAAGQVQAARRLFEGAIAEDEKPSLAHAYLGQVEVMEKAIEDAKKDFETGLSFNRIHYKCLTGLFDMFLAQREFEEAYEIANKISRYFPANPNRLEQVLRLAVQTRNVDHIENYYKFYAQMEGDYPRLRRAMSAALTVAGKYYLRRGDPFITHLNKARHAVVLIGGVFHPW
jgi:CheY-like chemotaxis protein